MDIALDRRERNWVIRMEGQIVLASAGDLKTVLLQWLADGKDLELDLGRAEEMDITAMQLLSAAAREAARTGVRIVLNGVSNAVITAVHDAGFDQVPGFPIQE